MIHIIIGVLAGHSPRLAQITGGTATSTETFPTNAVASWLLSTDGKESKEDNTGSTEIGDWLIAGDTSSFECKYSPTGDTAQMTGDAIDTWLNLGTNRQWSVTDSIVTGGPRSVTGTMSIGYAGTNTAIWSATVTLTAEMV